MSQFSKTVQFDVLRSLANGSISTNYATLGTALTHQGRIVKIVNNTDGDMFIAVTNGATPLSNGTADNDLIPAGAFAVYDFTTNSEAPNTAFEVAKGTQFWVRYSSAPTKNSVYLIIIYGIGQ